MNITQIISDNEFDKIYSDLDSGPKIFFFISPWDELSNFISKLISNLDWKANIPIYVMNSFDSPVSFTAFKLTLVPAMVVTKPYHYNYKVFTKVTEIIKQLTKLNHHNPSEIV